MINRRNIAKILEVLEEYTRRFSNPAVERVGRSDPFRVLVSTVISARTKDSVTRAASRRLFEVVKDPQDLLKIGEEKIAELIYPAGFYRTKARSLIELSRSLIDHF
ncbi:MAG: endonuclease III domain-containing protein, partial [Promethearchaeota archaeon]